MLCKVRRKKTDLNWDLSSKIWRCCGISPLFHAGKTKSLLFLAKRHVEDIKPGYLNASLKFAVCHAEQIQAKVGHLFINLSFGILQFQAPAPPLQWRHANLDQLKQFLRDRVADEGLD